MPLTEEGRRQARTVAERIAERWRPSVVYSSPLERCVQTAREICAASSIPSVAADGLNDLNYGAWEWKTHDEVRAQWPELFECWFEAPQLVRFPQGESLQDLIARTADVLRMVLEQHASDTVALVGHESGIRALLLQLLDQPISAYWRLAPEPASVSEVDIVGLAVKVRGINTTCAPGPK